MKKIIILIDLIASCIWANCEKPEKLSEVNGGSLTRVYCYEADKEVRISLFEQGNILDEVIHTCTYTNGYTDITYVRKTRHIVVHIDDLGFQYARDSLQYIEPYKYLQELRNTYGF